ncbi:MAG TPA: hypothetical protein VFB96_15430 [Pirellulaceae bacterium]|nr:hypothetical protein [Pirellulaceae bacterium]
MLPARRFDKSDLGLVLFGVLTIAGCIGGSAWFWPYVREAAAGPKPVTLAELRKTENVFALPSRWIEFPVTEMVDTEIRLVEEVSDRAESKYVLLSIEDRYLFAEVDDDFAAGGKAPPKVVGLLQGSSARGYVADALVQFCQGKPDYVPKLLPFVFQADYDVRGSAYALQGLLVAGVIIGAVMSIVGIRRGLSGGAADNADYDDDEDQFQESEYAESAYGDDEA